MAIYLTIINLIFEFMKKALFLLLLVLYASIVTAQNVLKGKVTDEQNQPLLGVSIIEKGTTNGVYSDAAGNYHAEV